MVYDLTAKIYPESDPVAITMPRRRGPGDLLVSFTKDIEELLDRARGLEFEGLIGKRSGSNPAVTFATNLGLARMGGVPGC